MSESVNFIVHLSNGQTFRQNMSGDFHNGFVLMFNSITQNGKWGNIADYERYDLDELDSDDEDSSDDIPHYKPLSRFDGEDWWDEALIVEEFYPDIKTNFLQELRQIEKITNVEEFTDYMEKYGSHGLHSNKTRNGQVLDGFVQDPKLFTCRDSKIVSYTATYSDGYTVFIVTEYSSDDYLLGLFTAAEWHGDISIQWGTVIDVSNTDRWTHKRFLIQNK